MLVEARNLMTKKIITIRSTMPLQAAFDVMNENAIRHLPVIDMAGKLVGILSDRDVLKASELCRTSEIEQVMTIDPHYITEDFMSWPVQTVSEKTSILELAKMMIGQKVSALVISGPNQYIKGIVTTEDLLQYLIEILQTSNENVRHLPLEKVFWKNSL